MLWVDKRASLGSVYIAAPRFGVGEWLLDPPVWVEALTNRFIEYLLRGPIHMPFAADGAQ